MKTALILTEDTEENITLEGKVVMVKPIYRWLLEGGDLELGSEKLGSWEEQE